MSNRSELAALVAADLGVSAAEADRIVLSVTSKLTSMLAGTGKSVLPGFGSFTVKTRAARTGRNPRSGDAIEIPEKTVVKFKPFPSFTLPT